MRNDWRCMLVYCGRSVEDNRCEGMYCKKKKPAQKKLFVETVDDTAKSDKKTKTAKNQCLLRK